MTQTFEIDARPEEDGKTGYVELRPGFVVPSRFLARNDELGLEIEIDAAGNPRVRAVIVLGEDIKTEHLRRLPIARLTREAVARAQLKTAWGMARLLSRPQLEEVASAYLDYVQNARPTRKGSPVTVEHLRQVADVYRAALNKGDPPTQTVADTLHASRPTAARWVQMARARGLLGAALPGRAGEATKAVPEQAKEMKR
jgi:hypothetical protein